MRYSERKPASKVSLILALARAATTLLRPSAIPSRETLDASIPDVFKADCCVPNVNNASTREASARDEWEPHHSIAFADLPDRR